MMETVLSSLTSFATWCYSQLGSIMQVITDTPELFIVVFGMSIVGFGVGLLKRLIHA